MFIAFGSVHAATWMQTSGRGLQRHMKLASNATWDEMISILATLWNLAWADLIVIMIIIAVIVLFAIIPAVIALFLVFIISSDSKKPPPLPFPLQPPRSGSTPDTTSEET
jgi:hypothetical protein